MDQQQMEDLKKFVKHPIYEITKRKEICNIWEALYFFFGYIAYVLMFIPIVYYAIYLPDYDTENETYKRLFARDTHYTTVFSSGKFFLWMTLMASGFAFVNLVNLMNQRRNPFRGRDGTYKDFCILMTVGAGLYFVAPIIALRSRHDMQRDLHFTVRWPDNLAAENRYPGCKGNAVCVDPYPVLPPLPSLVRFLIREFAFAYHKLGLPVGANCCYLYSDFEVGFHNICFVAAFCLGMNYTHLDFPPFSQFGFTGERLKSFTWLGWALLGIFISLVTLNFYYLYHVHRFSESHMRYVYLTIGLLTYAVLRTYALRNTHYVHIHHWT